MDLKTALIVGGLALILFALSKAPEIIAARKEATEPAEIKRSNHRYYSRKYLMTEQENQFFHRLNVLVGRYWFIVPRVSLPALLNHKVKGQNWSAALRHISGKYISFILISKKSGEIICAIELDDRSRKSEARIEHNAEIDRLFFTAGIPLARFNNADKMKDREILDGIRGALKGDQEVPSIRKVWDK